MGIKSFFADTSPNKLFTIDTFTRDASVQECIFDLIDNSIDAARQKLDSDGALKLGPDGLVDDYNNIIIEITVTQDSITINDNCGGMSPKDIENGVLRFGRPSNAEYSIGLYGIGLNRAIYKLGNRTEISSETDKDHSIVEIDMHAYKKEDDEWLIPAKSAPLDGKLGTTITITEPSPDIEHVIASPFFVPKIINEASIRYSSFLRKGLHLKINNDLIDAKNIDIRSNGPYPILTKTYTASNGVRVRLTAGQHENYRFTIEPDFDKKTNDSIVQDFGWSVSCNDRVVIHSNKEQKTGWEAIWHSEFNGFVGTVEFIAKDGRSLPWNTAKSDISPSNASYQSALVDMQEFTKAWRSFGRTVKKMRLAKQPLLAPPPKTPIKKRSVPKAVKPAVTIVKKPKPVKKPKSYREVLPQDVDEGYCNDKLLSLVHEAKTIDLYDTHYTGLALIRMLFETACVCFFIRHGMYQKMLDECMLDHEQEKGITLSAAKRKAYVPDLSKMLKYLIANYDDWKLGKAKMLKRSIDNFAKHKGTLNDSIHHPMSQISVMNAVQIRDEVIPVLRHFIEE